MGRKVVIKSVTSRNSKEFDDLLKQIQKSRIKAGKKPLSKIKLTKIIANKLKMRENLQYDTFTKI